LVLAGVLLAASACVHIRGTVEQPAVFRIHIEGLKHLDPGDLEDRLATHGSSLSAPIPIVGPLIHQLGGARQQLGELKKPPPIPILGPALYGLRGSGNNDMVALLDPDQLAVDRRRVEAYCRERGYYDAKVLDAAVVPLGPGQVDVVFTVEEGEPVKVARIDLDGLDAAPEARAALKKPALKPGQIFTVAAYDALRDQLLAALQNNGWATAEVAQEAHVLPESHEASVKYTIQAGARFRFGPILVAGTVAVPRDRIRQRAEDEIKTGAWYDQSKLILAQGRVFDLGVFGGVRVNRGTPDTERGIVPIVVAVREAPFRSVRLGPGFTVLSGTRIDLTGTAGWTHRNFLGDLRKLDLSLTAGWSWLLNPPPERKGTTEGPVGTLAADFSQPSALGRHVDLGARAEVQLGKELSYDFWAQRGRLLTPIHVSRRVTIIPSYNLEVYELSNVPPSNDPEAPSPVLEGCNSTVCLLSYLEQRIEWDGRDDPLNTRRGYYLALTVQEGGHVAGWGYQYLRFVPEARGFWPVGERSVVAAKVRLGAFVPVDENTKPPTVALFEAGGPTSMRGYGLGRLSPFFDTSPVGGNGLAEYSVETRFPVRGNLFGAVFLDGGYVSYPDSKPNAFLYAFSPQRIQWAAGVGIRYVTPIGPLRLDIAARLPNDLSKGVEFNDRFPPVPRYDPNTPSTHREPIVAFHISVGEAY
jgi:translocation and assembly module TamA